MEIQYTTRRAEWSTKAREKARKYISFFGSRVEDFGVEPLLQLVMLRETHRVVQLVKRHQQPRAAAAAATTVYSLNSTAQGNTGRATLLPRRRRVLTLSLRGKVRVETTRH